MVSCKRLVIEDVATRKRHRLNWLKLLEPPGDVPRPTNERSRAEASVPRRGGIVRYRKIDAQMGTFDPRSDIRDRDQDASLVTITLDGPRDQASHRIDVGGVGRDDRTVELFPEENGDQVS